MRRADDELNGYLDLVRYLPLKTAPADLGQLARAAVSLVTSRAARAGVSIAIADGPPVHVTVDARRVSQALVNLLMNAIDAQVGRPGGVRVSVATRAGMAEVEVADDGPGIDAALAKRLFQPFVTTKPSGTGLGLSISRRTCERHGGSLELAPGVGGARFRLRLPASAMESACAS